MYCKNMIKPTNRYQYILIEAGNEENEEIASNIEKKEWIDTDFDQLDTDWQENLEWILSFCVAITSV